MIGLIQAHGMNCPVVFCDVCHQPITHISDGVVVYRRIDDEKKIQTPLVVHRDTQEAPCTSAAVGFIADNGGEPLAQTLGEFMNDLSHNLTTKKEELQ